MRDPASRDPKSEAVIEDTCRFLERHKPWTEVDGFACYMSAAADEVEASNMPDWAKNFAVVALLKRQTEKRRGRPKQSARDHAIRDAAIKLVMGGYRPTRNETTVRDSASSIIHHALRRLGEKLSEKSINAIVAKIPASSFIKCKVSPAFFEYLGEHASGLVYLFESDPNMPDPVDSPPLTEVSCWRCSLT
jgi:hypothetical protein